MGPDTASDDGEAPLEGLRVVEISMYIQGPVAGLTLASLGADVIKIEQVGRMDLMRTIGAVYGVRLDERGQRWVYGTMNRGKRAIALDFSTAAGAEVFGRLIERADVFVTNLRDDALRRMGADAETLTGRNPRLVYARGGGFALRGPLAADPCQDTVGMAYGGFMDLSSPTDEPNYPPGALSDVLTGTNLASAVLAGLVRRSLTGKGSVVGTSQVQSLLWLQLLPVSMASSIGQLMARFSPQAPPNPLFHIYPTEDGYIAIAAIHPPQWPPIAHVLGLAHLLEDQRFATFEQVITNRAELGPIIEATFRQRPTSVWWEALRKAGVWTAPVNRMLDLGTDQHIRDNGYLVTFPDGFVGTPAPFEVGEWRGRRSVAAGYGEHTDEVLTELGYDETNVLELRAAEAIW
jgi:crotonobetainyl-CoA:carnitine CoA-transferase CaiB-like acyl-CoA transferase